MIVGLVAIGAVFVGLNLAFAGGPSDVRVFEHPRSAAATRGVVYAAHLLTPCAPAVDFDGSYWVPPGRWRLRQPAEPVTVELRGDEHAVLRTRVGQRFDLERYEPPLRLSDCTATTFP